MAQHILVADDEAKIVALVAEYLKVSGFSVTGCRNGAQAIEAFRAGTYDCLILDINMPDIDGLTVVREIRKESDVPVIFLTARTDEIDRIVGFELGADDYVPKPFSPRELVARVRAILRRNETAQKRGDTRISRGRLALDNTRREAAIGGREIELTAVQFDILFFMMREPGRVWTRLEILEAASGSMFEGYERTIDAHIKNIRKALGDDTGNPRYIETVRGIGYRFMEQAREQDNET